MAVKLALICTVGGHFEQMTNLNSFYKAYPHFWITNKNSQTLSTLNNEKHYYIGQAHFKKPWTYITHLPIITRIFYIEKPTHILSTGSGRTALIPFIVAQIMQIPFIYIETYSRVKNFTMLGTFILKMGHPVLTQWQNNVPGTKFIGPIIHNCSDPVDVVMGEEHVFVSLGTRYEPFTRLLDYVQQLIKKGVITQKVIVQAGYTPYKSSDMEVFDFCTADKIEDLILRAQYVITQESAGIVSQCLKYRKKFIVVPRNFNSAELPARADMKEDLHYHLETLGYTKVVKTLAEMKSAIDKINALKTDFSFDNSLAISILEELVNKK